MKYSLDFGGKILAAEKIENKIELDGLSAEFKILSRSSDSIVLILENNTIQPFSKIGSNTFLWSNNHIGHHSVIGEHCFLASEIVVSGNVEVANNVFIGVNATLGNNIHVGSDSIIGAGALTLKDVEPNSTIRHMEK